MPADARFPQIGNSIGNGAVSLPIRKLGSARAFAGKSRFEKPRAIPVPAIRIEGRISSHRQGDRANAMHTKTTRPCDGEEEAVRKCRSSQQADALLVLPSMHKPHILEKHWHASLANAVGDAAFHQNTVVIVWLSEN
eukprot:IDg7881t1